MSAERGFWACAALLLVVHAAFAIDALRRTTPTVDEVAHLPAGISYWQTGAFGLYHENPPLAKLLAAPPALAAGAVTDYNGSWRDAQAQGVPADRWRFGWDFMYANAARYAAIYVRARLPIVGLSLLTGLAILLWTRERFGPAAALCAAALWAFCPNAIAHAGVVTCDMAAASLALTATYAFWRYLRRPGWGRATAAGAALGLAQLAKFTLLLLYPLWGLVALVWWLRRGRDGEERPTPGRVAAQAGTAVLLSIAVINAGYGCEGIGQPLGDFDFVSDSLTRPLPAGAPAPAVSPAHRWSKVLLRRENRFRAGPLARLPVPLPRHYVAGLDELKAEGQSTPALYLCGERRRGGWWWYYLFALAVKVPLGTWCLAAAALVLAVRRGWTGVCSQDLALASPPLAWLAAMSAIPNMDFGVRYVLPALPFAYVALGWLATQARGWRSPLAVVLAVGLGWNALSCALNHPYHLAYFNELAGGREHGHELLLDSNLDWGQDLGGLARWLRERRPGQRVGLAYFGNVDPSILKAGGESFDFRLAPPRRLDDLKPVAVRPGSRLAGALETWGREHEAEVRGWVQAHGEESHWRMPALRALVARELELEEGPQPGLFAVSANALHGLPYRYRDQDGNQWDVARRPDGESEDPWGYFRAARPVASIGGSIFIYELTKADADSIRARLGR